jgi:hypothetical protein
MHMVAQYVWFLDLGTGSLASESSVLPRGASLIVQNTRERAAATQEGVPTLFAVRIDDTTQR